jgi:hypothetical protein
MISLHNRLYYNRCVSRIFIVPQLSAQTVKSKFPIAFLISLLIRLQDNVTGRYQYNNATVNCRKVQQVFGITFVFSTLYIQHRIRELKWFLWFYFDTRLWNVLFNSRQRTGFFGGWSNYMNITLDLEWRRKLAGRCRLLSSSLQKPGVVGGQTGVNGWNAQVTAALVLWHDANHNSFWYSSIISHLNQRCSFVVLARGHGS